MKSAYSKLTTLSEDIQQIARSKNQDNMDMLRFCRDHSDPVLFHDEKPVLDTTKDEFVGIFNLNSNHYFLSPCQVLRLAESCKLALPNTISLMIKSEWELYFSDLVESSLETGVDLGSKLKDKDLVEMYITEFIPDNRNIINLIQEIPNGQDRNSRSRINGYIHNLLKGNIFLDEIERIDQLYPEKRFTEKMLLNRIPEEQKANYFRLKELWIVKSTALDETLLFLERKKNMNLKDENLYYETFGNIEITKLGLSHRRERYRIILDIMQQQPELSYRELFTLADGKMIEADKAQNDLKIKIARSSCIYITNDGSSSYATAEFKKSYLKEIKKIMRKLFKLLHSDTCPRYSELNQHKKGQINDLWLQLMETTRDKLYSFSPNMLLYNMPDIEQLESIYNRACKILGIKPDEFELEDDKLEFLIKNGTPIQEIIDFFIEETKSMELHLAQLELVQNDYTNEDATQRCKDALQNINRHKEKLQNEIDELKMEILNLKNTISNRLMKAA